METTPILLIILLIMAIYGLLLIVIIKLTGGNNRLPDYKNPPPPPPRINTGGYQPNVDNTLHPPLGVKRPEFEPDYIREDGKERKAKLPDFPYNIEPPSVNKNELIDYARIIQEEINNRLDKIQILIFTPKHKNYVHVLKGIYSELQDLKKMDSE